MSWPLIVLISIACTLFGYLTATIVWGLVMLFKLARGDFGDPADVCGP